MSKTIKDYLPEYLKDDSDEAILELMNRRERQILVHSCIYYIYNENIISDKLWMKWAKELECMIRDYPDIFDKSCLKTEFSDFDHSTGFNLNMRQPWVMGLAEKLLARQNRNKRN